jgi:hypothetical protein
LGLKSLRTDDRETHAAILAFRIAIFLLFFVEHTFVVWLFCFFLVSAALCLMRFRGEGVWNYGAFFSDVVAVVCCFGTSLSQSCCDIGNAAETRLSS